MLIFITAVAVVLVVSFLCSIFESVLLSLTALLFLGIGIVRAYQKSRVVFFAVGWILLCLLPAANIIYLASRPIAEQRLYITSFGFCLLLAYGIERLYGTGTNHPGVLSTLP